ncbi:MAG: ABC transporter permease subunit [Clostridia bacterium]|nr:ABC transporter permease subunit [Clostridia bacterium]
MKTILTIIKKEFARFFKDTRLMLTTLILPGLLIFAMYSLMGTIMENVEKDAAEEKCTVYVVGLPESQSPAFNAMFDLKENYTPESAMAAVKNGGLDLFISFPQNFDELIAQYSPASNEAAPNVEIYFNSVETKSFAAYNLAAGILTSYEDSIANKFDINRPLADGNFDLADAQSTAKTILKMVVPMVLLMLLFSGCMAVAPESIAGEKERGTIATLLVTPVKRSSIAIGKIAALSVIALLSGLSSAIGMLASLPKLTGMAGGISLSMYGFGSYAAILAIVLSTVLILVTLISIVSAFAKSVKEATGLVVPLMIITMLCGLFSMFVTGTPSIGLFFIPVFNSALAISSVLSGALSGAAIAITVCMNIAFAALLVFFLTLMFKSEKIMFKR